MYLGLAAGHLWLQIMGICLTGRKSGHWWKSDWEVGNWKFPKCSKENNSLMSLLSSFDTKILLFMWIAPDQVKMENRESEKESERNEKTNQSLWTKESFNLAEDTERYGKGWEGVFGFELQRFRILFSSCFNKIQSLQKALNTLIIVTVLFGNLQHEPCHHHF